MPTAFLLFLFLSFFISMFSRRFIESGCRYSVLLSTGGNLREHKKQNKKKKWVSFSQKQRSCFFFLFLVLRYIKARQALNVWLIVWSLLSLGKFYEQQTRGRGSRTWQTVSYASLSWTDSFPFSSTLTVREIDDLTYVLPRLGSAQRLISQLVNRKAN